MISTSLAVLLVVVTKNVDAINVVEGVRPTRDLWNAAAVTEYETGLYEDCGQNLAMRALKKYYR